MTFRKCEQCFNVAPFGPLIDELEFTMNKPINWGILGTGIIARTFANAIEKSDRAHLSGVASRTPGRSDIVERFPGVRVFDGYDTMLESSEVEAVYISTNHSSHVDLAIRAAKAGKHIVCEKPVGISLAEAQELFDVIKTSDVFFMEAFMYRFHPQIMRAIDIVESGQIGQLRLIQAEFGFNLPFNPSHRIYNPKDHGGGLMDAGGYPLSMARLFAGVGRGKSFANPIELQGMTTLHETGVDNLALATLRFPEDIIAQISTGINMAHGQVTRLYGTKGNLKILSPWFGGGIEGGRSELVLTLDKQAPETLQIDDPVWLYEHEVNALIDGVSRGEREPHWPAMSWADSLGNMKWLEIWHRSGQRPL